MKQAFAIRPVLVADWPLFESLEERVWSLRDNIADPRGLPRIPRAVFDRWLQTNPEGFLGAFNDAGEMIGAISCEAMNFAPELVGTPYLQSIINAGWQTSVHDPSGDSWYVITIQSGEEIPGTGRELVLRAQHEARIRGKRYLAGICRIPGLAEYVRGALPMIARHYGIECTELVKAPVSPALKQSVRASLPRVRKKDRVLSAFARAHSVLYDVVHFPAIGDQASLNFGALIAADLTNI